MNTWSHLLDDVQSGANFLRLYRFINIIAPRVR